MSLVKPCFLAVTGNPSHEVVFIPFRPSSRSAQCLLTANNPSIRVEHIAPLMSILLSQFGVSSGKMTRSADSAASLY